VVEMMGAEVSMIGSVFEHVVDRSQHSGGDGADGRLRAPPGFQSMELGFVIAVFLFAGCPGALDQQGLQPGAPFRRREDLRLPALSF
jgi:hypothetical protein